MNQESLTLVLASQSPRRVRLLGLGERPFETRPMDVDETRLPDEGARDYVLRVAEDKARAAAQGLDEDCLIVAADTTVALDGRILAKPEDAEEARQMLRDLRGRSHQVYTAVALLQPGSGEVTMDLATTEVPMRDYTDAEIEAYVARGEPFDKAGGYAIQDEDFHPVAEMAGCFANVVGLPLCHLTRNLERLGEGFGVDMPAACQAHLGYDCPVFDEVLTWAQ
ncbi:MAG: septum formation protein Maf [Chloroflexi bacterium]|nr:septum formation protein Maf [Chloroflexota bacterium]